jgi:cyanoexosortase B-associated protein
MTPQAVVDKVLGKLHPHWLKGLLVLVLAAIASVTVLPYAFSGQWPWTQPPQVAQIKQLRALRQQGLVLPGWQLVSHQSVELNRHDWSLSEYRSAPGQPLGEPSAQPAPAQVALLLRPQPDHSDQPALEWMDLAGAQNWKSDRRDRLSFTVTDLAGRPISINARFVRTWNEQQTFAVMQWYAWPTGGSDVPNRWFWADQAQQWRTGERMPWIAVSLLVPIEPLGDIQPYQPFAVALAEQIQRQLLQKALQSPA